MSHTSTGTLGLFFVAPNWVPDPSSPEGGRLEDQLSVTLKAAGDEQEYQYSLPITEQTPATKQLEEWQADGKLVTVFSSGARAISFLHDTAKGEDGQPLKKYLRAGRKHQLGQGVTVESDAFLIFAAYDIRLAGQVALDQEATKARGSFLRRRAEAQKRLVAQRVEKARQRAEQKAAEAKAAQAAAAQAAQAPTATEPVGAGTANGRKSAS